MYNIDKDIRKSATLPTSFYKSQAQFEKSIESIFASSWLYIGDLSDVNSPGYVYPFTLLEKVVDESLVISCDKQGALRCLSNICTHRGKIIVEAAGKMPMLRCGYHGRCFRLDGSFKSTPGFENAVNFPTPADDLTEVSLKETMGLLFTSLAPKMSFQEVFQPILDRLSWLPLNDLVYDAASSKDYYIDAHWALYCDNYLEGFHIPFVHPALNAALEGDEYSYELYPYCNLQLGVAKEGELSFDIPEGAEDYGKNILAYYYWVFPNLMFNFYPWGLSLNVIQPLSHHKTKVTFRSYFYKDQKATGIQNQLDQTELEDEAVVENVQKGIQSRFYKAGRFSPSMEKGVHHFHRLIAAFMK